MIPDVIVLREEIVALARAELRLSAPLPEGDLSAVLDSMQRLSLVVAIEDRYHICFDPEDDQRIHSLDDVARLVHARLQAREQEPPGPHDP